MLRLSERQKLLNEVDSLLETMILYGYEKSKDFSQIMEVKVALSSFRYLNLRKHLAKNRSMNEMLLQYMDTEISSNWREWTRDRLNDWST